MLFINTLLSTKTLLDAFFDLIANSNIVVYPVFSVFKFTLSLLLPLNGFENAMNIIILRKSIKVKKGEIPEKGTNRVDKDIAKMQWSRKMHLK